MKRLELSNNQLKLIAMITMTVDHVGMVLFPRSVIFRIIGRLAFPVYAYMVAEGCLHTRSLPKYLASMAVMAAVCQLVYFFALDSLYQCILVTFSLSIGLLLLVANARKKGTAISWALVAAGIGTVFVITELLPRWLPGTDFAVDYGFPGVMLPVCIYLAPGKLIKLAVSALCLVTISFLGWDGQLFSLLALPLLALYNGQRGKWKMKWFFYLYYPVHLVVIYTVGILF